MASNPSIFLDDGGVMNDNALRGAQWQRLVGEFLAPRLGGDPEAWAQANNVVAERMWRRYQEEVWGGQVDDYLSYRDGARLDWLADMCRHVGVPAPDRTRCLSLATETKAYVTRRVHASYPGAVDALRRLHAEGYRLHTASGEDSDDLEGYLVGMKVLRLFVRLYGPDLINTAKGGPVYYRRIFDDAGVEPGDALVVGDSPLAISWAANAGARAVLVSDAPPDPRPSDATIGSLAELPALLERTSG